MTNVLSALPNNAEELQALLDQATSGSGTQMLALAAMEKLLTEARSRRLSVVSIEVYELEGEWQVPALEFGLYYDDICRAVEGLTEDQKVSISLEKAQKLFSDLSRIDRKFGVQVWLE